MNKNAHTTPTVLCEPDLVTRVSRGVGPRRDFVTPPRERPAITAPYKKLLYGIVYTNFNLIDLINGRNFRGFCGICNKDYFFGANRAEFIN